jgi:hypothetical protein
MKYTILILAALFFLASCGETEDVFTDENNYITGTFILDHSEKDLEDRTISELKNITSESQVKEWSSGSFYAEKKYTLNFLTNSGETQSTTFSFKHYIEDEEINVDAINITWDKEEPWRFDTHAEMTNFYEESGEGVRTTIFDYSNEAYAGLQSEFVDFDVQKVKTETGEGSFIKISMSQMFTLYGEFFEIIDGETFYRTFKVLANDFEVGFLVDFEEF